MDNPETDIICATLPDAEELLAYTASAGIALDGDTIKAIVNMRALLSNPPIPIDDQVGFWLSVGKLAKAAAPVTLTSLRETQNSVGRGFWRSLATRWIGWFSLLVIAVTIFMQIWAALLGARIDQYNGAVNTWQQAVACNHAVAPAPPTNTQKAADCPNLSEAWLTRRAAAQLLSKTWLVEHLTPVLPNIGDSPPALQTLAAHSMIAEAAHNLSDILYQLLLPFMYGLLGSVIYVLRTISRKIEERSYTWSSRFSSIARLLLGPILGIASLVIISPSKGSPLQNLPAVAIALVAGYSVDFLLSFMDRLIGAFRGNATVDPGGALTTR